MIAVARMEEQRGVQALEQAVVDHDLLAAPTLLGGRAEEHDLTRKVIGNSRQGQSGAHAGGRHRVVATAMT